MIIEFDGYLNTFKLNGFKMYKVCAFGNLLVELNHY
ncbi:MAG: hypothetical protein Satyrvirus36_4 [Satyrvirus sp.]|uniref:Uncharacterized protein n=1 Tax=Satyrvirus sp. TaxID=2487771 RepID=A0A3G5AEU7_9VIRU|nr:MAG: hypothetical protein Satyrvirus36_4 [Satyrvirus sp.]